MFDDIIKPKKVKVWGQKTLEKKQEKTIKVWNFPRIAGYSRGVVVAKSHRDKNPKKKG